MIYMDTILLGGSSQLGYVVNNHGDCISVVVGPLPNCHEHGL